MNKIFSNMNKNNLSIIFFFLMFLFVQLTLFCQTYFVDFDNGNNNANGLTHQTAWKHCPGDPSASGIAASTTLVAGDTVMFKGGVSYKGYISGFPSGNSSNYIVFKGNSGWGTGNAIFDLEATRVQAFVSSASYIKIQGFTFTDWTIAGGQFNSVIRPSSTSSRSWIIDSCSFQFMEGWNLYSTWDTYKPVIAIGSSGATGNKDFHITNNEFVGTGRQAIIIRYVDSLYITGNNFGGTGRGADSTGWFSTAVTFAPSGYPITNVWIQDNILHDGWQYGADTYPETKHSPNWIHFYGTSSTSCVRGVIVERNKFYNNKEFTYGTGSGMISIENYVFNLRIRNNILANSCAYSGWMIEMGGSTNESTDSVWIDNNTFIIRNYTGSASHTNAGIVIYTGAKSGCAIRNNIFYSDDQSGGTAWYALRFYNSTDFAGTIDYNSYYALNSSSLIYYSGAKSFDSYRSATSFDDNSEYNADGSAIFSSFPSTVNSGSSDYSLSGSASTFIKTGGIDLSSYFTGDYEGKTRTNWSIGAFEYNPSVPDLIAPRLENAFINNSNSVTLVFSESLNSSTAQEISNYSINNGIIIQSLLLSDHQVFLTTSEHISGNYTITVSNVTDLAGNIIDDNFDTYTYQYTSNDTIAPQLISAVLLDSVILNVYFSESLDINSAQNLNNYAINNITINSVQLDGNTVTLSTSVHTNGAYSLTVHNVYDLNGNIIDPQFNTVLYEYNGGNTSNLIFLPVANAMASVTPEPDHYAEKTIDGKGFYQGDPDSRWAGDTMPEWLVYDLGDIQILNKTRLSFFKWNEGRTYNYTVQVSTDSSVWVSIIENHNSVTSEWSEESFNPVEARYVKVIFNSSNQLNWASLWEAEFWGHLKIPTNTDDEKNIPAEFMLEQNYPNPFNPDTKIRFYLPSGSDIKLTVFNILGEAVKTITEGYYSEGFHEIVFNASDLVSGVYVYRLESEKFVENKKMVYLK